MHKFKVEIRVVGICFLSAFAGIVHAVASQQYDHVAGMAAIALFLGGFFIALFMARRRTA